MREGSRDKNFIHINGIGYEQRCFPSVVAQVVISPLRNYHLCHHRDLGVGVHKVRRVRTLLLLQ